MTHEEFPCTWIEDAGMWAGVLFIVAVAAAAGIYGQGMADLLNSLFLNL